MRNKILSLLVLLLTAATGAWAADPITVTWDKNTLLSQATLSAGGSATINGVTMTCVSGTAGDDGYGYYKVSGNIQFTTELGNFTNVKLGLDSSDYPYGEGWNGDTWTGSSNTVSFTQNHIKLNKITFTIEAVSDVDVTTNAATEGATFTEATFQMPDFDATVEYELVRDMAVQMTVQVGDGTVEQPRYRLKKQNNVYVPADMTVQQLMALITIHDAIEDKDLAFYGQNADCAISIFAVDANDQPTGNAIAFTALTPGRYVAQATAAAGSAYDGVTGYSNIFILYEKQITKQPEAIEGLVYNGGPQVLITPAECIGGEMRYSLDGENWSANLPEGFDAGNYTIYYKVIADENDDDPFYQTIENIIITEVPYEEAIATLLESVLHAAEVLADYDEVRTQEAYDEFMDVICKAAMLYTEGVKEDTQVTSKQIVDMLVELRNAEQAYLDSEEVTTGVGNITASDDLNGVWYDLNGRRLQGKPAKHGVYILNGKKVFVRDKR